VSCNPRLLTIRSLTVAARCVRLSDMPPSRDRQGAVISCGALRQYRSAS